MQYSSTTIFRLLQIAVVSVFAGRAYQHLFWDAPYREIFWDPFYTHWLIEGLTNMTWDEYVTNKKGDLLFQKFVFGQGVFYAICAVITVFISRLPNWARWLLVLGAIDLILLSLIYMKDKFYHFGQFFEYSLQFGTPLFLFYFLKKGTLTNSMAFWMKLATALTFACHGLYALGYYPRPELFMTMTQNILGLEPDAVKSFLFVAGIADFIVAFGLFMPKIKWVKMVLWYAVVWGVLTSFARIFGNFYKDFPLNSLHQWVFETVYRFPHFLVPLVLIVFIELRNRGEAHFK